MAELPIVIPLGSIELYDIILGDVEPVALDGYDVVELGVVHNTVAWLIYKITE